MLRLLCILVILDGISTVPSGILTRRFMQARRFIADVSNFAVRNHSHHHSRRRRRRRHELGRGPDHRRDRRRGADVDLQPDQDPPGLESGDKHESCRLWSSSRVASLLVLGLMNVDYIVVGRTLGPGELGLDLMAFNLSIRPVNLFAKGGQTSQFRWVQQTGEPARRARAPFPAWNWDAGSSDSSGLRTARRIRVAIDRSALR